VLAGVAFALAGIAALAGPHSAAAAPDPPGSTSTTSTTVTIASPTVIITDPSTGIPAAKGPLVVVPVECPQPQQATAVFEGTIVDAVATTARFELGRQLAGSLEGHVVNHRVDVRYADETRFLHVGSTYIVGARVDDATGLLVSTVREPAPLFGGDAVVGRNDSSVTCPDVLDPARTLMADGRPVETGVLTPLRGSGRSLLRAVLLPLAVGCAIVVALVLAKHLVFAVGRSLRDLAAGDPVERTRRHRHRQHG
jgi:hypothetical protein